MEIFIPFEKYNRLMLIESLKKDLTFKKLIISETSKQKYHSTSTIANFTAKGVLLGVNNNLLKQGTRNIDIGAGKFNTVTKFLAKYGIENIKYDPFLISHSQNAKAVKAVKANPTDSSTVNNVLNVIAEEDIILNIVNQAASAIKENGISIFTIYEGDKSGKGEEIGNDGYQNNMKVESYMDYIKLYFQTIRITLNVIVCTDPIQSTPSFWPLDEDFDNGITI